MYVRIGTCRKMRSDNQRLGRSCASCVFRYPEKSIGSNWTRGPTMIDRVANELSTGLLRSYYWSSRRVFAIDVEIGQPHVSEVRSHLGLGIYRGSRLCHFDPRRI